MSFRTSGSFSVYIAFLYFEAEDAVLLGHNLVSYNKRGMVTMLPAMKREMEEFNVGIKSTKRSGLELPTSSVKHARRIFVRTAARATSPVKSLDSGRQSLCGSAQILDARELRAYPMPSLPSLTGFLFSPLSHPSLCAFCLFCPV